MSGGLGEGRVRHCDGCGTAHRCYGPFVTKLLYRCLKCESQPKPTGAMGGKRSEKPRLDEIERNWR